MFPVLQEDLRERLRNILEAYFLDNCQSWALGSDGRWTRREPPASGGDGPFRVQDYLLSQTARDVEDPWAPKQEFVVRRSPPGES
jgi:polyphosphate kinase